MKGLNKIQNKNNKFFRECIARYLNPVNKNPAKIRNVEKEFKKHLNFRGIKFPDH